MKASHALAAPALMLILMLVCAPSSGVETRYLQGMGDSHYLQLESEVVGRSYHIFVMLPHGYAEPPEQQYPTLYVLDGGGLYPMFTAYYRYLNFGEEIPDAIIVGISYGSDSFEDGNYRSTDYTAATEEREYWGGAGDFQGFLATELFPTIERTYRSRADRRIVFGQSIGGQFVLYTALTRPDLFWGHIASNPALHRNLPFFLENHADTEGGENTSKLFVASGSLDVPRFRGPAMEWIAHWSGREDNPWQLETVTLEGHTHMSAPPAAFRRGLTWLFADD